jgi:hypothetical protein
VKWEDLKNIITKTVQAIGEERVQILDDIARLHSEHHLVRLRNLSDYDSKDPKIVAGKLLTLLISRRALGVQDPRDRLFAHVGLLGSVNLDESLLRLIEVDYTKDESLVFFEIAHFLTEAFQDYRILSLPRIWPCLEIQTSFILVPGLERCEPTRIRDTIFGAQLRR